MMVRQEKICTRSFFILHKCVVVMGGNLLNYLLIISFIMRYAF